MAAEGVADIGSAVEQGRITFSGLKKLIRHLLATLLAEVLVPLEEARKLWDWVHNRGWS